MRSIKKKQFLKRTSSISKKRGLKAKEDKNKVSKEENYLEYNYRKCFEFFRESRWFIIASLFLFSISFIVGYLFPYIYREEIIKLIKELLLSIEGFSLNEIIRFIFLNNIRAAFFSIFLGIFFGLFSILVAILNGYIIGFVSIEVVKTAGIGVLWRLVPHGIFELPAIIISVGLGMKLGFCFFKKNPGAVFINNLKESLRFFISVILPLIIIAAIIEGFLIIFT